VEQFFTSNWGECEPLKNPLVLPEISDGSTWERCRAHIPLTPEQVEEALPNLSRCMLKVIGWVRPNGNMNLTKYMDYLSQAGLDEKTLELTKIAHEKCSQRALSDGAGNYKEQDKIYVECIFRHFDKTCPPNFQAAVKQGYIVGITQISFVPRYDDVEMEVDSDADAEDPNGAYPGPGADDANASSGGSSNNNNKDDSNNNNKADSNGDAQ
ncbi:hypothetical protein BIW11_00054, partial [Tropilaelaps mercedesae]